MTTNFFSDREIQKLNIPPYINANHPVAKYLLSLGKMARHGAKTRLDTIAQLLEPGADCWQMDWKRVNDELMNLVRQKLTQDGNSLQIVVSKRSVEKHLTTLDGLLRYVDKPTPTAPNSQFPDDVLSAMLQTCNRDKAILNRMSIRDAAVIALLSLGLNYSDIASLQRSDYSVRDRTLKNQSVPDAVHQRMVAWTNTRSGIKGNSLLLAIPASGYASNQPLRPIDVERIVNHRLQQAGLSKSQ